MALRGDTCFAPPFPTLWPNLTKWEFNDLVVAALDATPQTDPLHLAIVLRAPVLQFLNKWPAEYREGFDTRTIIALTCEAIVAVQRAQYELAWAKSFLMNESLNASAEVAFMPFFCYFYRCMKVMQDPKKIPDGAMCSMKRLTIQKPLRKATWREFKQ